MSGSRSQTRRRPVASGGVPPASIATVVLILGFLFLAASFAYSQDLNGDGRVDAVFTQKQRYNQVCFGNGSGAFTNCFDLIGAGQHQISNQINTTDAALVDFDGDGDLDIALAMEGHASVVCYNDGTGDFNAGMGCVELYDYNTFPYFAQEVVAADIDGDGAPDLLFANGGNAGLPLNQPNLVCFGFNSAASACYEFGPSAPSTGMALGDVDGDGDQDILVSEHGTLNTVCLNGGRQSLGLNVDCRSIPKATTVSATKVSNAVAVGNLAPGSGSTPDGLLDIAFANDGKNEVCFGTGNWTGSNVGFNCLGLNTLSSNTLNDAAAHTLDVAIGNVMSHSFTPGDEIVFANADAPNVRCYTTFTCTFAYQPSQIVNVNIGGTIYAVSEPIVEATTGVAIRDINIDGRQDVVIANVGISRTALNANCCSDPDKVANATLHPTSVTLSGGDVGPAPDSEPPAFFGATNVTVEATSANGAVATFTVTALDSNDGVRPVTCAPASGSVFQLGNTTVTCTAADLGGNQGSATLVVNVRDTTGPVITVPANFTVFAPAGQVTTPVTFTATGLDAVDGARTVFCFNTATNFGVLSGDSFPGGILNLDCGAYDTRQNYGQATFSVTVVTDIDNDGVRDDVDADDDGDGIADSVDSQNTATSSAYAASGTNSGTVTRNSWTVSIAPTASGSAYALRATLSGAGTAPAIITAYCEGVKKELRLDGSGETVEWRCDNRTLAVRFVSGTPEFWKLSCGAEYQGPGLCGYIKITGSGNAATAGSPVTADANNTSPLLVTILDGNEEEVGAFSLDPGESVDVSMEVGEDNELTLHLEVLNGGSDGNVVVTLFGQTVSLAAGSGPATFDLNPDLTPPAVTAQVSGTLGANGFYTSSVTVSWTAIDAESAVTSTGCATQSVTQDTAGVTFTCSAASEGGSTTESVTIKRDATAPVVTVPAPITVVATSASGVAVTYAVTPADALDSTPALSCAPASGATFPVGTTTVNCSASDDAGNAASASFTVTVDAPADPSLPGVMHGEGRSENGRDTYKFRFRVNERQLGIERGHLVVEYDDSDRDRKRDKVFRSTAITSIAFSDDPAFRSGKGRKAPPADTVVFQGVGTWGGQTGYAFEVTATDQGEGRRERDTFSIVIRKVSTGQIVASTSGTIDGGNIQSERLTQGRDRGWWR